MGTGVLGRLPAGTVLTFEGQIQKGFISVSVELQDGAVKTGWILEDEIEGSEEALQSLQDGEKEAPPKKKRAEVPEDEKLLIKRESSFFYGVQAGPNYSFIATDVNTFLYTGLGFTAGAVLGTYFDPKIPVRLEVNYSQRNGESADDLVASLSFNFMDVAIIPCYLVQNFELGLGLQYSFGLGISQVPRGVVLTNGAGDLSSLALPVAVGYRFGGSETLHYVIRARYDLFFNQSPLIFQAASLIFALEFHG